MKQQETGKLRKLSRVNLGKTGAYALAFATIVVWSSTFISTKVLLDTFTPIEILLYRFLLAYVLMFALYPRIHRPESLKSELKLVLAGLSGGSVYFLAENFALEYSLASNVSLLVSTAPILTAIVAHFALKDEPLGKPAIAGALIAFLGVGFVVFNGKFVLRLNPVGDLLALVSSASWAIYSIVIRTLDTKRSSFYITRKIFFYTLLTILPVLFFFPPRFELAACAQPKILINLLFLTLFASCGAYVVWNRVIKELGAVKANNLIYFIPVFTLAESAILLNEPLSPFALAGAALIVAGVYVTSRPHR